MLRSIFTLAGVCCLTTAPALAQFESMQFAMELGSVIGSEEFCSLSYDQTALAAFVEKNVSAEDMAFTGYLDMAVGSAVRDAEKMTGSQKTAHCAQIKRAATFNGFLPSEVSK